MPREDLRIKDLREQLSTHKGEVIRLKKELKSLDKQYVGVIKELRKMVKDLMKHPYKAVFGKLILTIKKVVNK